MRASFLVVSCLAAGALAVNPIVLQVQEHGNARLPSIPMESAQPSAAAVDGFIEGLDKMELGTFRFGERDAAEPTTATTATTTTKVAATPKTATTPAAAATVVAPAAIAPAAAVAAATTAAAIPTQMPSIVVYEGWSTIAPGNVIRVPMTYTQTFASALDERTTAGVGHIGLATGTASVSGELAAATTAVNRAVSNAAGRMREDVTVWGWKGVVAWGLVAGVGIVL